MFQEPHGPATSCSQTETDCIMSGTIVQHLLDLLRDHVDDPPPVATAEHIDASMNFEELDYEPYRLRLHHIQLPDSLLVTRVDRHPDERDNKKLAAFFERIAR